jgi:gluconolactonase
MLTPEFQVVDQRFLAVAYGNVHLERLASGYRWAEGPAYFAAGRYLVWSDLPNDRTLRWDETDGSVLVFQHTSNFANGHTIDREGRLICCEHLTCCISRTEIDGSRTVLASPRPRQAAELAQRRGGQVWRLGVVHRSFLWHRF